MLPDTGDKKVTIEVIAIVHLLCCSERMLNDAGVSLTCSLTSSLAPMIMRKLPLQRGSILFFVFLLIENSSYVSYADPFQYIRPAAVLAIAIPRWWIISQH